MQKVKRGLEGVVVGESSVSHIDGKKGKLIYRGYSIEDLAQNSSYEEVAYLLIFGKLPNKSQLENFRKKLHEERDIPKDIIPILKKGIKQTDSMDVLNTAVSFLAESDKDLNKNTREAEIRKAIRLTAKFPTIVAYYWRLKQKKKPIPPKKNLSPGANFLYMLRGEIPSDTEAIAMELDFVLTAEHGINASTFATMVATATETDFHSAVTAGIATLKGPLHGAARKEVYKMLDEVKSPKKAKPYILKKIKKHERIMGFGHRVYKAYDPRAKIFKEIAGQLAKEKNDSKWYDISLELEKTINEEFVVKKKKPIYPNVDFWTGAVYKYLEIPKELSTGIFAIARIAGWTAHILEQRANNRLIRPKAIYTGPKGLKYPKR